MTADRLKTAWLFLVACLLAPAANALEPRYIADKEFGAKITAAAKDIRQEAASAERKIYSTLIGMQDSVGVGEQLVRYIWQSPISVEFADIEGISERDEFGGTMSVRTIFLNKNLPAYPRVLSIAIAQEVFGFMHEYMPECAEKRYMEASVVARTWIELGGSKDLLPIIEPLNGYTNAEMEKILRTWVGKPSHLAIREIQQSTKLPSLQHLLSVNEMRLDEQGVSAAQRQETRQEQARLEEALKTYVDFMMNEREWDVMHPGQH